MKRPHNLPNGTIFGISTFKNLLFIFLLLFLAGCGFQSRKYTTGHFWDGLDKNEYKPEKQNEKQKQGEKKSIHVAEQSIPLNSSKSHDLMAVNREVEDLAKDTLIKKWAEQKSTKLTQNNTKEKQIDKKLDPDITEKKIRRSTRGFITFWSIKSLFYLGLLINAFSPDAWGFWLAIFGILTAVFMIPVLVYLNIMKIRHRLHKEQIQDEKLKKRIPKLSKLFAVVMLAEAIMLILGFVLGGYF
jgi:hypothetical protein